MGTVAMIAPNGQSGDIPVDKVQAAQQNGFKPAYDMVAPDGKTEGYVPKDQVYKAQQAGFKISNLTQNPAMEGTYGMVDNKGNKVGIPYSLVDVAHGQGYQFDNSQNNNGLTPAQQFTKDQAADPNRTTGTSLHMAPAGATYSGAFAPISRQDSIERENAAEAGSSTAGQIITGMGKGGGQLARPVLDAVALHTGQTPQETSEQLAPVTPAQKAAKYGYMGAMAAPAVIEAPVAAGLSMAGGAVGGYAGQKAAEAAGLSPQAAEVAGDVGGLVGGVAAPKLGSLAVPALGRVALTGAMENPLSVARDAAIGDTDAAAMRGLKVPPGSPKMLSMLQAKETAAPYLQGAQNLEDLQSKIAPAKAEVWAPYQEVIDKAGDHPIPTPDSLKSDLGDSTTLADLEEKRLQLSAQNRALKTRDPAAIQLAQQKGLTQADLLQQESDAKSAIDPVMSQYGVNAPVVRSTFAAISKIGQQISGKSTLIQPEQPSGFGKIAQLSIKNPLQAPAQILSGARDLVAGRPIYSASPVDLGIKEGFANAGPKPNLGTPRFPEPAQPLQLPAQAGGAYPMPGTVPYSPAMTAGEQSAALNQAMQQAQAPRPLQLPASVSAEVPITVPFGDPGMSAGERSAALNQWLRRRQQMGLPAQASPIQLTPPQQ